MRSAAILIVVTVHSSFILAPSFPRFPWLPLPDGVDLFFVLSGYLVGGILMDRIGESGGLSFSTLRQFILRRWFRTLPNYFLFLGINIGLVYFGLIGGDLNKYLLTYFVFFQNFYIPFDFLFWESWSLTIEEWFYLSFPLLCFLAFRFRNLRADKVIPAVILIYLLAPLLYRIWRADAFLDEDHWDLFFRKLVLTRLDSIGYGVLAAYLSRRAPGFWRRIRIPASIVGLLTLAWLCRIRIEPVSFFLKTTYLSLMPLAIALLLPLLAALKTESIKGKPFEFISRISYSMYFCNGLVFQVFSRNIHPVTATSRIGWFALCWLLVFCLSWIIYRFFELPSTVLRERFG
jgi:peptidoglycan/LPS O-acetylase OafA/YrhL